THQVRRACGLSGRLSDCNVRQDADGLPEPQVRAIEPVEEVDLTAAPLAERGRATAPNGIRRVMKSILIVLVLLASVIAVAQTTTFKSTSEGFQVVAPTASFAELR